MVYAIGITDQNDQILISFNVCSKKQLKSLKNKFNKDIIDNDKTISKFNYYFPNMVRAKKIKNVVFRTFSIIVAFFLDSMSLPFFYYSRKKKFRNDLSIYKNLRLNKVPEKYLKTSEFFVYFFKSTTDREGNKTLAVECHAILF